jgi:hypothetical protein
MPFLTSFFPKIHAGMMPAKSTRLESNRGTATIAFLAYETRVLAGGI